MGGLSDVSGSPSSSSASQSRGGDIGGGDLALGGITIGASPGIGTGAIALLVVGGIAAIWLYNRKR